MSNSIILFPQTMAPPTLKSSLWKREAPADDDTGETESPFSSSTSYPDAGDALPSTIPPPRIFNKHFSRHPTETPATLIGNVTKWNQDRFLFLTSFISSIFYLFKTLMVVRGLKVEVNFLDMLVIQVGLRFFLVVNACHQVIKNFLFVKKFLSNGITLRSYSYKYLNQKNKSDYRHIKEYLNFG